MLKDDASYMLTFNERRLYDLVATQMISLFGILAKSKQEAFWLHK